MDLSSGLLAPDGVVEPDLAETKFPRHRAHKLSCLHRVDSLTDGPRDLTHHHAISLDTRHAAEHEEVRPGESAAFPGEVQPHHFDRRRLQPLGHREGSSNLSDGVHVGAGKDRGEAVAEASGSCLLTRDVRHSRCAGHADSRPSGAHFCDDLCDPPQFLVDLTEGACRLKTSHDSRDYT